MRDCGFSASTRSMLSRWTASSPMHPRAAEVNPAADGPGGASPSLLGGSREGIIKTSCRHPVNDQFLDMVDAAGHLNARTGGHRLIPLQYRQFVFPGVLGHQETGLVRGALFATDRTQMRSEMIHKAPFNSLGDALIVRCIVRQMQGRPQGCSGQEAEL